MRCDRETMRLYAVTDRAWAGRQTLIEQIESAIKGGATCVQLREKALDEEDFLNEAMCVQKLCKKYGIPFIVNDNVRIAVSCGADGVHVGQKDMPPDEVRAAGGENLIIGVSARTVEQAVEAEKAGADYIGVGAVFRTSTKTDTKPVSYETLKEICNAVKIPVVAIGGINKENILTLSGSGIAGVAVVSAIFAAKDIEKECVLLKKLVGEAVKK